MECLKKHMNHLSIKKIREEHATIAALLTSLVMMVERGPKENYEVYFDVLRAMLFYLDEFPAKHHHPKEDVYLFYPLRKKRSDLNVVLNQLTEEHSKEEDRIRELQHMLQAWEYLGESRRREFEIELVKYVNFYREHLRVEETQVIPAALQCLTDDEWKELDVQFERNAFTLNAIEHADPAFNRLFAKIVSFAPAPIGLGKSD